MLIIARPSFSSPGRTPRGTDVCILCIPSLNLLKSLGTRWSLSCTSPIRIDSQGNFLPLGSPLHNHRLVLLQPQYLWRPHICGWGLNRFEFHSWDHMSGWSFVHFLKKSSIYWLRLDWHGQSSHSCHPLLHTSWLVSLF